MSERARRSSHALLALLLLAPLTAQERVATGGRVLGRDGKPVANATVHFLGSRPPLGHRFEPADPVTVQADDKGRFKAMLRERFDYVCWALGPSHEGAHLGSAWLDVRPGAGIELELTTRVRAPRLILTGLDAWQTHGPLRLEVALALPHHRSEPLVLVDGSATLPVAPPDCGWHVFVCDASGWLWSQTLEPGGAELRCRIPAPRALPVRVHDEQGRPVAGAALAVHSEWMRSRASRLLSPPPGLEAWRVAAHTDDAGRAAVVIPCTSDPFAEDSTREPTLMATKLGYAAAVGGWNGQRILESGQDTAPGNRELLFILRQQPALRGSLIGLDGEPVRDVPVSLSFLLKTRTVHGGVNTPTSLTTRTAADGSFSFDSLPELQRPLLHVPGLAPEAHAPALLPPGLDAPLVVDARQLVTLRVTARASDGTPARHADLVVMPSPGARSVLDANTWHCRLDSLGTALVPVQRGDWGLFVTDGRGFAHAIATPVDTEQQLSMVPFAVFRGRVAMPEPGDAARAEFLVGITSHVAPNPSAATSLLRAVGTHVNRWLAASTTLGADGSFAQPFLYVAGTDYVGTLNLQGRHAPLHLKDTPHTIEVEWRKP